MIATFSSQSCKLTLQSLILKKRKKKTRLYQVTYPILKPARLQVANDLVISYNEFELWADIAEILKILSLKKDKF